MPKPFPEFARKPTPPRDRQREWHTAPAMLRTVVVVFLLALAFGIRYAMQPLLSQVQPFSSFFVAVIIIAVWIGWKEATFAALAGFGLGVYFFAPIHGLAEGLVRFLSYAAVTGTIIALGHASYRHQARLRESETSLRILLETGSRSILAYKPTGEVMETNESAAQLFEQSAATLKNTSLTDLLQPHVPRDTLARWTQVSEPELLFRTPWKKTGGERLELEVCLVRTRLRGVEAIVADIRDVTGQRQAEQQLHHERELTEAAINSMPGVFYLLDKEQRLVRWNKTLEIVLGYEAKDLKNIHCLKLIAPEDHLATVKAISEVLDVGHATAELRLLTAQGQTVDYFFNSIRFQYGGELGLLGLGMDLTQRRMAENAMVEALEQRRLALAGAQLGTWDFRPDTDRVYWDERVREILGMREEVTSHRYIFEHIHPDDRDRVRKELQRIACGGASDLLQVECRVNRSGSIGWVLITAKSYFEGEGPTRRAVRMVGTVQDITDRKKAEDLLRESEAQFRQITEAMPQLVWLTGPEGQPQYVNQRWCDYTGQTREQALARWLEALHPDDRERSVKEWNQSLQTGKPLEVEFRLRSREGQYTWFLVRAVPLRVDNQITRWFGTCTDISQIMETREAMARHSSELERLVNERTAKLRDTVHELEHFSYALVHDMRAPLRAMMSFSNLACEEWPDPPGNVPDYLRRIESAAKRMDHLITDALNYSKAMRQDMPLRVVDLGELLHGIIESYPHLHANDAIIELMGTFPKVYGNEAALTQCFSNLLGNAVKFVAPGSIPRVRVHAEPAGEYARIWVEDNGIGIDDEYKEQIFGMFQRLHSEREYEGTGVGLAIAQKVVDRMSGRIGLESTPGQGSRFWVELRRVMPASQPAHHQV